MGFLDNIFGKKSQKSKVLWDWKEQPHKGKHEVVRTTSRMYSSDFEDSHILTCKNCEEYSGINWKEDKDTIIHPHGKWKPISKAYKK